MVFVVLGYALFEKPHEFSSGECRYCHASAPKSGQKSPLPMMGKIRTLCSRCHFKLVRSYSHPDDVAPVNAHIPEDMPLSADMTITCATCHNIHSDAEWSKSVHLLRRPVTGAEFCSVCHSEKPGQTSHKSLLAFAHDAGSKYLASNRSGSLDSLSVECISCHDSSIGKGDSIAGAGFWIHSKELAKYLGGHPIGVSYSEAAMNDPAGYKPASSLAPLRLFNGKVGCGSCHDPYSTKAGKLVMSNESSRLCLKCHNR